MILRIINIMPTSYHLSSTFSEQVIHSSSCPSKYVRQRAVQRIRSLHGGSEVQMLAMILMMVTQGSIVRIADVVWLLATSRNLIEMKLLRITV
jgi:hypothetical protein